MWLFELMGLSYHNRRLYANTDKRLITIAKNYTALCYGHSNWRSVPEQETVSTTAADRAGAAPDTAGPGGSGAGPWGGLLFHYQQIRIFSFGLSLWKSQEAHCFHSLIVSFYLRAKLKKKKKFVVN